MERADGRTAVRWRDRIALWSDLHPLATIAIGSAAFALPIVARLAVDDGMTVRLIGHSIPLFCAGALMTIALQTLAWMRPLSPGYLQAISSLPAPLADELMQRVKDIQRLNWRPVKRLDVMGSALDYRYTQRKRLLTESQAEAIARWTSGRTR